MPISVQLIRVPSLSGHAVYANAAIALEGARLPFLVGSCPLNEDGASIAVG